MEAVIIQRLTKEQIKWLKRLTEVECHVLHEYLEKNKNGVASPALADKDVEIAERLLYKLDIIIKSGARWIEIK